MSNKLSNQRLTLPRPKVCISKSPGGPGVPPGNWTPQQFNGQDYVDMEVAPVYQSHEAGDDGEIQVRWSCQDVPPGALVTFRPIWNGGVFNSRFEEIEPTINTPGFSGRYKVTHAHKYGTGEWWGLGWGPNTRYQKACDFAVNWRAPNVVPPPPLFCSNAPMVQIIPRNTPAFIDIQYWSVNHPLNQQVPTNYTLLSGNITNFQQTAIVRNSLDFTGQVRVIRFTAGSASYRVRHQFASGVDLCESFFSITWV